jgi:hypothetical protein
MKTILFVVCFIFLCTNVFASFGYITETATGNIVSYFDLDEKPADTDENTFTECSEAEKPDLYEAPAVLQYDADSLISWAFSQVFVADLIPHMAAFLDFANKATEASKDNFLAYASAVGLTSTANTIVAKAIELGADLEA